MCIFIHQVRLLKKWRPLKQLTHFWHYAVQVRTISFWAKLISGKQTKLSAIIYKCMNNMLRVRDRNFMWLKYVKHILCNCGFNYIWDSQTFIN